jgi:hypothetical protein
MVFLAITSTGLAEALRVASAENGAVWCSADALSEEEFEACGAPDLTRFTFSLQDVDAACLAGALATIAEHHPGQHIWVEGRA